MKKLEKIRKKIDNVDDKILNLLSQRFSLTREIGLLKAKNDLDLKDKRRESKILKKIESQAKNLGINSPFCHNLYKLIFKTVLEENRNRNRNRK